jgi:hypothetical protein
VAAKECAIFRSKRAESDMRVKRPCHDAFDRNKLYADVSWLASDAIASMGLKKGKRNALQIPPIEYQYSQHVAADLPDRQDLQQLQNSLRARLTQAKMPHRGVVLLSPWSWANYSTPDCH